MVFSQREKVVRRRADLYEEVWAEPVLVVAKRYSISDVALAKTCRKLGIPLPGRGYWARKRARQKLKRPPLPPAPKGVPDKIEFALFDSCNQSEESRVPAIQLPAEYVEGPALDVPSTLERPHKLVAMSLRLLRRRDIYLPILFRQAPARTSGERGIFSMDPAPCWCPTACSRWKF